MKVYMVRHGECRRGTRKVFLPGDTPLSDEGIRQAQCVAKRFLNTPVEVIISSHYERASQTAKIIAETINKKLVLTELAKGRKVPKEIVGQPIDDLNAASIKKLTDKHFGDPAFRYSDEENSYDLKARATELLNYISKRKEGNILVVLHGTVMRCVIALMMFGNELTYKEFNAFRFLYVENTGITVCEKIGGTWKLLTWNDYAHLG